MFAACIVIFSTLFAAVQTLLPGISIPPILGEPKTCYPDLGCFTNEKPFFNPVERPLLPLPEKDVVTLFLLFNKTSYTYLKPNKDSLMNSNFNPGLGTKIIVHGYNYDFKAIYMMDLIKKLVDTGNYNVIFANWTENKLMQTVANARVVGAQIAQLVQFIHEDISVPLESVHLIGHSLGAHVCGWAGERLPNLGRITGLDPGGPYAYDRVDLVSLDHSDALFVDIIHTNGGHNVLEGIALEEPIGHIDFYPNGGNIQPGADLIGRADGDQGSTFPLEFRNRSVSEARNSHIRAVKLFTESVDNSACKFIALACDNYDKYTKGECDQKYRRYRPRFSAEMGFHAVKPENVTTSRRFYLKTNGNPRYCIQQ